MEPIEEYLNLLENDIEELNITTITITSPNSFKDYMNKLNLRNTKLNYIPNIDKFYNLKILCCHFNKLKELPLLPNSLQILLCYNNNLCELQLLPNSLQTLYCWNNNLKELQLSPKSLKVIYCWENSVNQLNLFI